MKRILICAIMVLLFSGLTAFSGDGYDWASLGKMKGGVIRSLT